MSTGHYGGASMAIPIALFVVVLALSFPAVIMIILLISMVIVGIVAIAAAFSTNDPRRH